MLRLPRGVGLDSVNIIIGHHPLLMTGKKYDGAKFTAWDNFNEGRYSGGLTKSSRFGDFHLGYA